MKTIKNILKNLLVILISTFFTLLILEILLRVFGHQDMYTVSQYPKEMFCYNLPARLCPGFEGDFPKSEISGHIKINSKGLRDYERPYEKNGIFRILGLGDSFVFGHGVEFKETFLVLLEDKLNTFFPDSIEIIKAGTPGTGPQAYYNILEKEGLKYEPDLVLVNIFVGNDINDIRLSAVNSSNTDTTHTYNTSVNSNKTAVANKEKNKNISSTKNFLRRHVHLYSFVVDRLKSIPAIRHFLQKSKIASGIIGAYVIDILRKDYTDEYKAKWEEAYNTLKRMKLLNDNLVICIIPSREQLDEERLNTALDLLGYKKEDIDIEHPNRLIKEFCVQNNLLCIDLLPVFKESGNKSLYFDIDPHFNREGHILASEIIYNELINNKKIK